MIHGSWVTLSDTFPALLRRLADCTANHVVGLRLSNEEVRVAVAHRLGCRACEPHACRCGKLVDARGLHGLACRRSESRQQRHCHMNDIIWRATKRAQIHVVKEPVGLMRQDGKRPDGTTMVPWSRGKTLAWDVTVSDT